VIDFAKILRGAGLTFTEEPGWQTSGHGGELAPVGGVWHHTGGLNAQGTVVNGRAGLAGPLANLYLRRDGSFHIVTAGVAWHAGPGSGIAFGHVHAGVEVKGYAIDLGLVDDYASGNHQLVGIEVEALGNHSVYPAIQVRSLVTVSAALARELDWTEGDPAAHWIHHREWTRRKVDMDLADKMDLRALVRAELAHVPVPPSSGAHEGDPVLIITTPQGPDHRGAAVLVPSPTGPLARYLSPAEWTALYRVHVANPAAVAIEERPVAEHDALTGGPA
jgi:hypothetical protein